MTSIFKRIIDRELPADIVYEDDLCICIKDIAPQAPIHLLLIPKKPIVSLAHLAPEDGAVMVHMMFKLQAIASAQGVGGHFKTQIHTGSGGGQEVFHLHLHLLGDPAKVPNE